MADVKWIKIVTDIFDDEKILLIEAMPEADSIITIWFKLLCLAGKQNNSGVFILNDRIPYTDEMFATIFRRKIATVRLALTTFENLGMIEVMNGVVTIPNWCKHQNLDAIESRREYMRQYMRGKRDEQKLIAAGKSNSKPNCKPNSKTKVSNAEGDIEENRQEEKRKEGDNTARSRFTPPTLDDVQSYCKERNNRVDAERFIDYYASNGWKVGKNQMKDWRAAVRNWERDDKPAPAQRMAKRGTEREIIDDWDVSSIMNRPRA